MRTLRSGSSLACLSLTLLTGSLYAQDPPEQRRLVGQLLGGDQQAASDAVARVLSVSPQDVDPAVRRALITHLGRLNQRAEEAIARGVPTSSLIIPEHRLAVVRAVARLDDPMAIPALTGALGPGFTLVTSLAAFGDAAAPSLLAAVSGSPRPAALHDGLVVLRMMVERRDVSPLSAATITGMESVAHRYLAHGPMDVTLRLASDLAVVLEDPELMHRVEQLATTREAIVEWGVTDQDRIERTQRYLRNLLAGVPPLPRWRGR